MCVFPLKVPNVTEILGGEAYVSCSVVLPALCHLRHVMEVTEDDPAYVVKFKTAFKTDLASRQENTNNEWLKIATALDPRFKALLVLGDCSCSNRSSVVHTSGLSLLGRLFRPLKCGSSAVAIHCWYFLGGRLGLS